MRRFKSEYESIIYFISKKSNFSTSYLSAMDSKSLNTSSINNFSMKKLLSLFCSLYFVLCTSVAIAYKASDEANAQFLADENLIVKQSAAAEYRLDDTITRAEVV